MLLVVGFSNFIRLHSQLNMENEVDDFQNQIQPSNNNNASGSYQLININRGAVLILRKFRQINRFLCSRRS